MIMYALVDGSIYFQRPKDPKGLEGRYTSVKVIIIFKTTTIKKRFAKSSSRKRSDVTTSKNKLGHTTLHRDGDKDRSLPGLLSFH